MSTNGQKQILGPYFSGGVLQSGVKLYTYEAGSVGFTSPKLIWQDRSKSIKLPNPFQGDGNGLLSFFGDGLYKLIIAKASSTGPTDQVLYTEDNFSILDTIQSVFEEGEVVTASSTINVGPGIWTHIIGGAPIAQITGDPPFQWLAFDVDTVLEYSALLVLPNQRNRTFKTGDVGFFLNDGDGIWRLANHFQSAEGAYDGRLSSGYPAASTLAVPADGDFVDISGADLDISAVDPMPSGYHFTARFLGSGNQLLHSTNLVCPNANDYRLITNEVVEFRSLSPGVWIVVFRSGPSHFPGQLIPGLFTVADDGCYLPLGQTIVCTRHQALAKRLIPAVPQLGTSGTSVGAVTFDNATDVWTRTSHGLVNGDLVHLTNSGGGLPTGFGISTPYWVINAAVNTFQLSATRGGATVNGTTNGTGTHTVHNKVQLPNARGRTLIVLDNLGGVAANVITAGTVNGANAAKLAGTFGEESHVISIGELPGTGVHPAATAADGKSMMDNSPPSGSGFGLTGPAMAIGAQIRW